MWNRLHQGLFPPPLTDLHSFPLLLCPSLLFASPKHPGRFLHPLICSETIISVCSCFLSRFFSSLASFICLSGPLFASVHQETSPTLDSSLQLSSSPSSSFPVVSSHLSAPMRHHLVFEIAPNKVRCWLHAGCNPEPMNLIGFSRKLQLRDKSAK